jgi:hypothetical protein
MLRLPTLLFNDYHISSLQVNLIELEAEYPPPSIAKVKNEWSYTSTSTYAFIART